MCTFTQKISEGCEDDVNLKEKKYIFSVSKEFLHVPFLI